MTLLRELNERGIREFRTFLQQIREGQEFQASPALLYADDTTRKLSLRMEVTPKQFASKLEAARFLNELLAPFDNPSLTSNTYLWSWLALYYFDQLSPVGSDGKRRPREDYHYIPSPHGWERDRHLLAGPYNLYRMHGDHARLLLYPPIHQHGTFIYDLAGRTELITNRGLVEAIDQLYWNRKTRRPKQGATNSGNPGNLRRLMTVIEQLAFNYDLYGMTAAEIVALLPREFDIWKGGR